MSGAWKTVGMTMTYNRCDIMNIKLLAVILVSDLFVFRPACIFGLVRLNTVCHQGFHFAAITAANLLVKQERDDW